MDIINLKNRLGDTPLMCAVKNKNLKIIEKLLCTPDIDINISNNDGYTPYTYALVFSDKNTIELFESFLNNSNTKGYLLSSICDAVHNRDYSTISHLLKDKCDINVKDNNGYSPFLYAVAMNDKTTIELFLNIVGVSCFDQQIKIGSSIYNAATLAGYYNNDELRHELAIRRLKM
tara:strand:- start:407 stop:931 length:525 start_codon:yes stop_codon:yes gene_type:complete